MRGLRVKSAIAQHISADLVEVVLERPTSSIDEKLQMGPISLVWRSDSVRRALTSLQSLEAISRAPCSRPSHLSPGSTNHLQQDLFRSPVVPLPSEGNPARPRRRGSFGRARGRPARRAGPGRDRTLEEEAGLQLGWRSSEERAGRGRWSRRLCAAMTRTKRQREGASSTVRNEVRTRLISSQVVSWHMSPPLT